MELHPYRLFYNYSLCCLIIVIVIQMFIKKEELQIIYKFFSTIYNVLICIQILLILFKIDDQLTWPWR